MKLMQLLLTVAIVATSFVWAAPAFAQKGPDKLMRNFVRPQLLMRHQKELGLTKTQKTAIKNYVKAAQSKSIDIKFELEQEMQKLEELVAKDSVDKRAAVAQANKVMELENRMKAIQLGLMIDVKNVLTPEQIETIKEHRNKRRGKKRGR